MNKSIKLLIIPILSLSLVTGCAKYTSDKTIINDNTSNNSSENIEDDTNTPNNDGSKNDATDTNNNTNNSEKPSENPPPKLDNSNRELLTNIMNVAKKGKVINSEFAAKSNIIDDVKVKLGEPDSSNWVAEAKGTYDAYSSYSVAFGHNKGSQLFEVRSFDNKIKSISLSDLKEIFGNPDYDVTVSGEEIVGYVVNDEFKLLFVFPAPSTATETPNPKLDHYSVLYPRGTVNSMADDPGREW